MFILYYLMFSSLYFYTIQFMDLILQNNSIDVKNITLKHSLKCIKIIYDLGYILLLGISLKLNNCDTIFSNNYIYITIHDYNQKKLLKNIDIFLQTMVGGDYNSFINDKNIIKVKNNKGYKINDDIYISLNNLKQYNERWKLHIFTI